MPAIDVRFGRVHKNTSWIVHIYRVLHKDIQYSIKKKIKKNQSLEQKCF